MCFCLKRITHFWKRLKRHLSGSWLRLRPAGALRCQEQMKALVQILEGKVEEVNMAPRCHGLEVTGSIPNSTARSPIRSVLAPSSDARSP